MEDWKDVKNYEGYYKVSSEGRVKSIDRKVPHSSNLIQLKGRILKLSKDKDGYLTARVCRANIRKHKKVHRLVAEAFLDRVEGKNIVNHLDGNKSNNHFTNLEYCTAKENHVHAVKLGLKVKNKRGIYVTN